MKFRLFFVAVFIFVFISSGAIKVDQWLVIGPLPVQKPEFIKGKDIRGNEFRDEFILSNSYINLQEMEPGASDALMWDDYRPRTWSTVSVTDEGFILIKPEKEDCQIAYTAFYLESAGLYTFTCEVESPQMFEVFLDGKRMISSLMSAEKDSTMSKTARLELDRGKFLVLVKTFYRKGDKNKWKIRAGVSCSEVEQVSLSISPESRLNIHHLLEGTKLGGVSLSADGSLAAITYSRINTESGKSSRWAEIKDVGTGRIIQSFRKDGTTGYRWTPRGSKLWYTMESEDGTSLYVYDFETMTEAVVMENADDPGNIRWTEDEKYIFYERSEEKQKNVKSSLLYMDELGDRTFRTKSVSSIYRFNVNTGVHSRLTFGEVSTDLNDVSHDGSLLLFSTSRPNPTERPFTLQNMYLMNLDAGKVDTLWKNFRHSGYGEFSPDATRLLISGGPDLFGATGRNIGDRKIANNYDGQLYIYTLSNGEIDPITRDFDPAVAWSDWHAPDDKIYARVSDEIYERLYAYDTGTGSWSMLPTVPEVVRGVSIADEAMMIAYTGNQQGHPDECYTLNLGTNENLTFDVRELKTYKNVKFGRSEEWDFVKVDGTKIRGYFLYPMEFDPAKKYPLIVNYYGGTSPIEKSFGGRYPQDIWAGEGYVVYVPQPSGATGFGQEFSARHQNNWGKTTIDEIIEGTRKFMRTHDFVDSTRIGCIGASYGGFTTMLLTSHTDMFACAISHAGISSISSYWGEGYWGYIYSSEATGDSYPWNRKDIYIDQSALFRADRINTPLLLLHGSVDTNVPLGESLQLWVGLKILGKPVEMVQVEGENHWILSYSKRIEWHNTIMAWFDKFLKDEGHDWKKLFPESKL